MSGGIAEVAGQARMDATPTTDDASRMDGVARKAMRLITGETGRYPEILGAEFGGSYAKGTWVPGYADIDIFVRFGGDVPDSSLGRIGIELGLRSLRDHGPFTRHSDHPYVEASIDGIRINVVPFYDVAPGGWRSAADRSTYHTRFMKEHLTPEMKGEVRALKRFLRAGRIYGAEIAREGFSGYVSEVLVLNFGTFRGVVSAFAGIEEGHTIGETDRAFDTPIVIVDPVDSNRNLAAAISEENIGRMILRSRAFLAGPDPGFFEEKRPGSPGRHLNNVVCVSFGFRQRSSDIIWGQVKSATASMVRQLELAGFSVVRSSSHVDQGRAYMLFLLESVRIPELHIKEGPDFFRRKSSGTFIRKNLQDTEMMWIGRNRRILSLERRRHVDPAAFLDDLLKGPRPCIGGGLLDDVRNGFSVQTGRAGGSVMDAVNEMISTDDAVYSG